MSSATFVVGMVPGANRKVWALLAASTLLITARADFPKNLLRTHAGASWVQGAGPSLNDDPSEILGVKPGAMAWVADMGQHHVVDRVTFHHVGLVGRLRVESTPSLHLPSWQTLGTARLAENKPVVAEALIPTVGRFLRFTLETTTPGELRGLGIFGPTQVSELQLVPETAWAETGRSYHSPEAFSLLNGLSNASVASVSAGKGDAESLRDEDVSTSYQFSARHSPVIELDLGFTFDLKCIVVLQDDVEGEWAVTLGSEMHGRASRGVARIELGGQSARTLELRWLGTGNSPLVYEIAVFPVRGLAMTSGYGKNASTGKNASLGKQPLILSNSSEQSPGGNGKGVSPYFGVRGAGALPGFAPRAAGAEFAADDDGGPIITPGSF